MEKLYWFMTICAALTKEELDKSVKEAAEYYNSVTIKYQTELCGVHYAALHIGCTEDKLPPIIGHMMGDAEEAQKKMQRLED